MHTRKIMIVFIVLFLAATILNCEAQLSRERTVREWNVKAEKMNLHLQSAMRKHGIDLWIIMSREFNPDPMLELFGGCGITGWYGHRNAYIFFDPGNEQPLETVILGTHQSKHMEKFFHRIVGYGEEGLSPHLKKYFAEKNPETIAINQSRTIPICDGLTVEMKKFLVKAIGPEFEKRMVSSEPMLIDYVSARTPAELTIEREASWKTWNILLRVFSNEVITPGKTTLMDLHYWVVDEWRAQGLDFNFPPGFDIQRRGVDGSIDDAENPIIQPGDILHVDFGIKLMGLVTDQQKMAYVLRPGETEPPAGLKKAFAQSIEMAEIVREGIRTGKIGHKVRDTAQERGKKSGIENSVYSHVQGNWVHDIGAWANPDWPDRYGRHPREPVRSSEFWSIEFSTTTPVPEWNGQKVRMAREEDAYIDENGTAQFLTGPQMELWLIRPIAINTDDQKSSMK